MKNDTVGRDSSSQRHVWHITLFWPQREKSSIRLKVTILGKIGVVRKFRGLRISWRTTEAVHIVSFRNKQKQSPTVTHPSSRTKLSNRMLFDCKLRSAGVDSACRRVVFRPFPSSVCIPDYQNVSEKQLNWGKTLLNGLFACTENLNLLRIFFVFRLLPSLCDVHELLIVTWKCKKYGLEALIQVTFYPENSQLQPICIPQTSCTVSHSTTRRLIALSGCSS